MMVSNDKKISSPITCSICRAEIVDRSQLYQVGTNLSVVCTTCHRTFSEEDLHMMVNLFLLYGGYFGMLGSESFSSLEFVGDLVEELDATDDQINIEYLNTKMLHNALLHGLTPEQYVNELKMHIE
ncbi:hypothetical protein LCGC14_3015140 [marine sediment metagenome]|uniref:Uncharacterized protein n=1 Tax=marine sediment metagenome TaxID=412755 RepID=A0A0F8ZN61_9ZZZZ